MAGPCLEDSDCVALSLDGSGNLIADLIVSPDASNALECRPNGAFATASTSGYSTATTPASAPFVASTTETAVQTGTFAVTNPSLVRPAKFLIVADCGSCDLFSVSGGSIVSVSNYTRVSPAAFALAHRLTYQNGFGTAIRNEEATAPEFFGGSLAAGASVTVEVQRRVLLSGVGGQGTVGRIVWHGLVVPS